ncbi:MAG: hypothetical protein KDD36_11685 [Flavobacteriales bacterium]|nr:hypothetical protein [Flavobacteriales bacterium]
MRTRFTIFFSFFLTISFAQQYRFTPKWEAGHIKSITYTILEQTYKNKVLTDDSTYTLHATLKVVSEDEAFYTIEYTVENPVMKALSELYDKLVEEVPEYKDQQLICSVSKDSGQVVLLNWKEVRQYNIKSYNRMEKLLAKKAPDRARMAKEVFMPVKQLYENENYVKEQVKKGIGFLCVPFERSYTLREKVEEADSAMNPFNPSVMLETTETVWLKSYDEKNEEGTFIYSVDMDFSKFVLQMKDVMMRIAASMNVEDSVIYRKQREVDQLKMDMTHENMIIYDNKTTWVTKSVNTIEITGVDPKNGPSRKVYRITAEIE